MPHIDNEVAAGMRELRRVEGLTQAQLAKALGMAATSIYRYEAGSQPDPFSLFLLARYAETKGRTALRNTFIKALGPVAHLFGDAPLTASLHADMAQDGPVAQALRKVILRLDEAEKVELFAYASFLKQNTDATKQATIEFLLQPWRNEALARFSESPHAETRGTSERKKSKKPQKGLDSSLR